MPASTRLHANATLTPRHRLVVARLSHVDRATGEPVCRYEHHHPGVMLHVDAKKLGNIHDGGGWRYVGRQQGEKNRAATAGTPRNRYRDPLMGKAVSAADQRQDRAVPPHSG